MSRTEFNKPASPCPVCGSSSKGCSATDDGLHFCRGTPTSTDWAKLKDHDNGFVSYRNDADPNPAHVARNGNGTAARRRATTPRIEIDWNDKVREYAAMFPPLAHHLAAELNLPPAAFAVLPGVGFSAAVDGKPVFCFPERDATGTVVGLCERFPPTAEHPRGEKKVRLGGNRGLSIPAGWRDRAGPVFLVEGASDTIAISFAGLAAVGRPGNKAGIEHLAGLLRDLPADRPLVVVGENDRKPPTEKHPEGEWPGREGAEFTAGRLAAALGRPVLWALTPAPAKDVRAWLTDPVRASAPWAERGVELSAMLVAAAAGAEPVAPPDENDDPTQWAHDVDESHRLASAFLASLSAPGQPLRLRYWREEFHEWQDGCYHTIRDGDLKARMNGWVHDEHVRVHALELRAWEGKPIETRRERPKVRNTTIRLVADVMASLKRLCLVSGDVEAPCWLDGTRGPDPRHLLAVRNGLYDLNAEQFLPHSASYLTFAAAGFDYIPDAACPTAWTSFLRSVWCDDPESIACLQEWFGYLLTADTRQQKLLFLLGPTRAGKGTIATVLKNLVGSRNVTNPTLSSLAGTYGLWPLVGKSVALISDARISGRTDSAQVVESLLRISGEDSVDVERKYLPPITNTKLSTRFIVLSNELPNLADASSALVGRMILLRLTRSFYGSEDTNLADRLLTELPGILLWSIAGVRRLRERGRFTQPRSGAESIGEMKELASPVSAFVRERCNVGRGSVEVKDLFDAWKKWCEETGRREHGTIQIFGRNLTAAHPSVKLTRPRKGGVPTRVYEGIKIKGLFDDELETAQEAAQHHQPAEVNTTHPSTDPLIRGSQITNPYIGEKSAKTDGAHRAELSENRGSADHRGSAKVSSSEWLYVSKKLDFITLPVSQTLDVVQLGPTLYHRITPAVVVWLEHAVADRDEAGGFAPDEVHAVITAQTAIYSFARDRFADGELDAARKAGPQPLPDAVPEPDSVS